MPHRGFLCCRICVRFASKSWSLALAFLFPAFFAFFLFLVFLRPESLASPFTSSPKSSPLPSFYCLAVCWSVIIKCHYCSGWQTIKSI
ncbi:hypothetical protein BC829DRAFT_397316 [Chytridium lagenaria]|nr:hypothetical protein BC829DRAFT_397316 [Chytridium lagenaria]